jgi:hypothetical protein
MRTRHSGRIIFVVQALLIGALAIAGLIAAATSPTGVGHVASFSMNTPHSVLLLATAGASLLAVLRSRIGRFWAMIQAGVYTVVFLVGTAASTGHSQDTWLKLNTSDHFLHLGLALLGGVLSTGLFWPTAPDAHAPTRIVPGQPPPPEQRPPQMSHEDPAHTQEMIAAEVAVTEGRATPEQERRVQQDAQRRADAEHRRAWKHYEQSIQEPDGKP